MFSRKNPYTFYTIYYHSYHLDKLFDQERLNSIMKKKHLYFTISIALLSLVHLLFSYFYVRMYGYFNLHGNLNSFVLVSQILRFVLDAYIIVCGFFAIREEKKKIFAFLLTVLLFNLIMPFFISCVTKQLFFHRKSLVF